MPAPSARRVASPEPQGELPRRHHPGRHRVRAAAAGDPAHVQVGDARQRCQQAERRGWYQSPRPSVPGAARSNNDQSSFCTTMRQGRSAGKRGRALISAPPPLKRRAPSTAGSGRHRWPACPPPRSSGRHEFLAHVRHRHASHRTRPRGIRRRRRGRGGRPWDPHQIRHAQAVPPRRRTGGPDPHPGGPGGGRRDRADPAGDRRRRGGFLSRLPGAGSARDPGEDRRTP